MARMNFRRHSKAHVGLLSCSLLASSVGCASSIPRLALGPYAGPPEDTRTHLLQSVASTQHEVVGIAQNAVAFEILSHSPGYSFSLHMDERGVVHLMPQGPRVRDVVSSLRMPGEVRDEYLALAEALRASSFNTVAITDTDEPSVSFDARDIVNPIERHNGADQGLLIAGGVTFGVGYLMSVLAGAVDQSMRLCGTSAAHQGCDAYPLSFIPVAGAVLVSTETFNGPRRSTGELAPSFYLGVLSLYPQVIGLITILIGAVQDTTDIVPGRIVSASLGAGVTLSASLSAPSSEAGFNISIVF